MADPQQAVQHLPGLRQLSLLAEFPAALTDTAPLRTFVITPSVEPPT